jgi:hypothetical protein
LGDVNDADLSPQFFERLHKGRQQKGGISLFSRASLKTDHQHIIGFLPRFFMMTSCAGRTPAFIPYQITCKVCRLPLFGRICKMAVPAKRQEVCPSAG